MAKQLLRYHQPTGDLLKQHLLKECSLVMKNGSVFFGDMQKIEASKLYFIDKIKCKHQFFVADISELVLDKNHSF
jgi:hypothetical protein